jgi:hypothetical protein
MQIDFWFTMGSTYSYLSVMRLREKEGDITFRWRPFHLLIILQEMNHVPFADKPAKMAYMWRDVARRAEMYGIPARLPAPYPAKQSIVANLVALVGMQEGWGVDFVRAAYRNWFQRGEETGSEPNLSHSLARPGRILRGFLHWRSRGRRDPCWCRRPRRQSASASSVLRPSPSVASCSGATTGWRTRSPGRVRISAPESG